jgi:hypothetical protein
MWGGRADVRPELSLQVDVLCSQVSLSGNQPSAETSNKSNMLRLETDWHEMQPTPHPYISLDVCHKNPKLLHAAL